MGGSYCIAKVDSESGFIYSCCMYCPCSPCAGILQPDAAYARTHSGLPHNFMHYASDIYLQDLKGVWTCWVIWGQSTVSFGVTKSWLAACFVFMWCLTVCLHLFLFAACKLFLIEKVNLNRSQYFWQVDFSCFIIHMYFLFLVSIAWHFACRCYGEG